MQEIEIKGKNVEETIRKGLQQLGCTREQAEIKVLDEGTTGLFGLMGAKPARVLITAESVGCKPETAGSGPEQIRRKVEKVLTEIFNKMSLGLKSIKTVSGSDSVNAEIETEESGYMIGKNRQTLDSLEYINADNSK